MQRITVTVDDGLLEELDRFMGKRGVRNRSEALRDLMREGLERQRLSEGEAEHCIAILSYVYNHHERELAKRLTRAQHHHHDLHLSTLHVHLDHEECLESMILRGRTENVRRFAHWLMGERGVRHGSLHLVPAELDVHHHAHRPEAAGKTAHFHSKPKT